MDTISIDFAPSPAEIALTHDIFERYDPEKLGIIMRETAAGIFIGTKLPPVVLAEAWNIVDEKGNGLLSRRGFAAVLRLMGHAQRGKPVSKVLLSKREWT